MSKTESYYNKFNLFKIQHCIFFMLVILLPFCAIKIPRIVSIITEYGGNLSWYFASIGILIFIYSVHTKNMFMPKLFTKFYISTIIIILLSFIVGILTFDFYQLFATSLGKNALFLFDKMIKMGIPITLNEYGIILCFFKAVVKDGIFSYLYTFGAAAWIACLFINNWEKGIKTIRYCFVVTIVICLLYSLVEVFYLKGYSFATYFLIDINPYLYHISNEETVAWPPLLWGDRMRSIFPEPSYLGIYLAPTIPILSTCLLERQSKIFKTLIYFCMISAFFLLFGTNSKTSMVLIGLVMFFPLIFAILYRNEWINISISIFISMLVGSIVYFSFVQTNFVLKAQNPIIQWKIVEKYKNSNIQYNSIPSKQFIIKDKDKDKVHSEFIEKYIDKNITNVTNVHNGSGSSRYGVIYAELGVFYEKPILGAGSSELMQPYIYNHIPDFANNEEVRRWSRFNWQNGVMSHKMAVLDVYASILAKNGLAGIFVYFLPLYYFLYCIYKRFRYFEQKEKYYIICLCISIGCMLISGFSNTLTLLYSYWVFLGLLGAVALTVKNKEYK